MSRTAKRPRCRYSKRLNAQRLRRDDKDKSRVAVLDGLGISLELLASLPVRLLQQLVEHAMCDAWQSRTGVQPFRICPGCAMMMTCAVKFSHPVAGLFFASDET